MPFPARWITSLVTTVLALHGPSPAAGQSVLPDSIGRQIDRLFTAYDRAGSPGCVLGVYRDGRMVYARGYGSANLEHGVPLAPSSVFDITSTSKQFTAMAILLLARDGKLGLDDDVRKYVPELPDYGATITVRHLLHHTSGLRDYITLFLLAGGRTENVVTQADVLEVLGRQRALDFSPGTRWEYSNSGYILLSAIVKRVSGRSLRDFAKARIFEPLDMTHTHVHDDYGMVVPRRATGYAPSDSGGSYRIRMSHWTLGGDGAVVTSVEDLLKWDRNFYSPVVGDSALLAEMVRPRRLESGLQLDYAAGLIIGDYRGLKIVHHGGGWAGYRSQLLRFPTERVSVACLCNLASANPGRLAQQVADVYLADRLGPPEASGPGAAWTTTATRPTARPGWLSPVAGTYREPRNGSVIRIALTGGKPRLTYGPGSTELEPVSSTEFRLPGGNARLHFNPAGPGRQRRIRLSGIGPEDLTFEAIVPVRPGAPELGVYVGQYFSPELLASYRIALERDSLVLLTARPPTSGLVPTIQDEFENPAGGLILRFSRTNGRTTGFRLTTSGARGIRFERRP